MREPNQTEKAIVAALEPLMDDLIALEKQVAQLQRALTAVEKRLEGLDLEPSV